jgi:hypothetical protein
MRTRRTSALILLDVASASRAKVAQLLDSARPLINPHTHREMACIVYSHIYVYSIAEADNEALNWLALRFALQMLNAFYGLALAHSPTHKPLRARISGPCIGSPASAGRPIAHKAKGRKGIAYV